MDKEDRKIFLGMFLGMVGITIVSAFAIAVFISGDPMLKLKLAVTYALLVLVFLFGFVVLAAIASGVIDISKLLEDDSAAGGASTSRFSIADLHVCYWNEFCSNRGLQQQTPRCAHEHFGSAWNQRLYLRSE